MVHTGCKRGLIEAMAPFSPAYTMAFILNKVGGTLDSVIGKCFVVTWSQAIERLHHVTCHRGRAARIMDEVR